MKKESNGFTSLNGDQPQVLARSSHHVPPGRNDDEEGSGIDSACLINPIQVPPG